jgi:MraZ protein
VGAAMFRGVSHINMDAKFRIAIPTRYRELLLEQSTGRMVANIDLNQPKCLVLYPSNVWVGIEERIQSQLLNAGKSARILRLLLSHASDVDMDANGRLLLPAELRTHINLEAVLLGLGKKLELWREDDWLVEQAASFDEIEDAALVEKIVGDIGYI